MILDRLRRRIGRTKSAARSFPAASGQLPFRHALKTAQPMRFRLNKERKYYNYLQTILNEEIPGAKFEDYPGPEHLGVGQMSVGGAVIFKWNASGALLDQ